MEIFIQRQPTASCVVRWHKAASEDVTLRGQDTAKKWVVCLSFGYVVPHCSYVDILGHFIAFSPALPSKADANPSGPGEVGEEVVTHPVMWHVSIVTSYSVAKVVCALLADIKFVGCYIQIHMSKGHTKVRVSYHNHHHRALVSLISS